MPDPDLVERLDPLACRALTAASYRHIAEGRQPLSGEGARIQGGRWNPAESFPTLYLGMTEDVVAAEFQRLVRRSRRSIADFFPRELYRIDVTLELVLDLTDPATAGALRVARDDLRSDDLATCQAIGDAAHYLGIEAILAPSVAAPGSVLAVYTDRLRPASVLTPHLMGKWDASSADS
jgi:RES domain-containing protein